MPAPIINWYGNWNRIFLQGMPRKWFIHLRRWLLDQRWFLGKVDRQPDISLQTVLPVNVEHHLVWWLFLHARSGNQSMTYQLPLVLLNDLPEAMPVARLTGVQNSLVFDAWQWPPFARAVLSAMADGNTQSPLHRNIHTWRSAPLDATHTAQPVLHEQTNTTIVFENAYFLKALRQVVPGRHPEHEMCMELTQRNFPNSIPLLAGLELVTDTNRACIALLSPLIKQQDSGWNWFHNRLDELGKQWNQTGSQQLIDASWLLGKRTCELHQCLAQPSGDPDFQPVPFCASDYRRLLRRISKRYAEVVALLARRNIKVGPQPEHVMLFKKAKPPWNQLEATWIPANNMMMHRIHGDYHLGQVLRTEHDWLIIDFEGEPLRSLEDRRARDLPWRDVAGMLRSFHYLAATTSVHFNDDHVRWDALHRQIRSAFLDGYIQNGQISVNAATKQLLHLYELEKSLYEIEYELVSRPDWLHIPLRHAVELLYGLTTSGPEPGASKLNPGESVAGH